MDQDPKVVIIAGPNGAGKTTFAKEFLVKEAKCPAFVNADLIASGLSPFFPEEAAIKAGRLMLKEIIEYAGRGESFAFETTLSGRIYARYIQQWRSAGYQIKLIFFSLPNVEIAVERVKIRVAQGGHSISETVIRRRFDKGWHNFNKIYKKIVDAWVLYDNSGRHPQLIDQGENR